MNNQILFAGACITGAGSGQHAVLPLHDVSQQRGDENHCRAE